MRKLRLYGCLFVISILMLVLVSCAKDSDVGERKRKEVTPTSAENTPTPSGEPTGTTVVTPTPEATPTGKPTDVPTEVPTPTVEPTGTPVGPTGTPGGFTAPEPGCAIDFPTRKLYHYDMKLVLDPDKRTVSGHVEFDFYNDTNTEWQQLCMRDYSSLFINAETAGYSPNVDTNGALTEMTNIVDGRDNSTLTYERDEDVSVLWLALANPLAPGENMTLSYDFTATIPTVADRYGVHDGIFNVTNFYPILAEYDKDGWSHAAFYNDGECFYSEVSNYDVRITVPHGYTIATTGTEVGVDATAESVTYLYEAPCVRDFVFSTSNHFGIASAYYGNVRVNVLYNRDNPPASDMDAAVQVSLKAAEDSLAAFGEAFGRYPYDELDIILAPIDAGGMEYPNLIIITDYLCEPYITYSGYSYEDLEICIAHEIGHQWFMGIVGSNSGMQPWQDESITSYTEVVYLEYLGGSGIDEIQISREYTDLCRWDVAMSLADRDMLPLNRSYYEFSNSSRYITAIYSLGQIVLYQMEEIVGRDEFHAVLREYVHRNAFTNADPESFFEVLFECAGTENKDLNTLIENCFSR